MNGFPKFILKIKNKLEKTVVFFYPEKFSFWGKKKQCWGKKEQSFFSEEKKQIFYNYIINAF